MYVPVKEKTNIDWMTAKKESGNNQLDTFVDRREKNVVQKTLINSINQSASPLNMGVMQRTKEAAVEIYPWAQKMDAKKILDLLNEMLMDGDIKALASTITSGVKRGSELKRNKDLLNCILFQKAAVLGLEFKADFSKDPFMDSISEFVDIWNDGNLEDPIYVIDLFVFTNGIGMATPTESAFAKKEIPGVKSSSAVAYIGSDNLINSELLPELQVYAGRSKALGREEIPNFFTSDLVLKNKLWSIQRNVEFIRDLTNPYIRICHAAICDELAKASGDVCLIPNKRFGTRDEVNMLFEKGYVFMKPCFLLHVTPDIIVKGLDVTKMLSMGASEQDIIDFATSRELGLQIDTIPQSDLGHYPKILLKEIPHSINIISGSLKSEEFTLSVKPNSLKDMCVLINFKPLTMIIDKPIYVDVCFSKQKKRISSIIPPQQVLHIQTDGEVNLPKMVSKKCFFSITTFKGSLQIYVCIPSSQIPTS